MESAIPDHLRTERTRHTRFGDDYSPAYPSFVARLKPSVERLVMAYFGVQFRSASVAATQALEGMETRFAIVDGPRHWDRAKCVDQAGYANVLLAAYWDDIPRFDRWFEAAREAWVGDAHAGADAGFFIEVVRPSVEAYETVFGATDRPAGVAALAESISGEIREHGYWGSMRDRIPLSQNSGVEPKGDTVVVHDGPRIRVKAHDNLCLIRSGQDWSETVSTERALYLNEIEPTLRAGMEFLRDQGSAVGCYDNRYANLVGPDGGKLEKSYGMSWWKGLAALEHWSGTHPTHLRIFGLVIRSSQKMGDAAKLQLYHEVTVARADEQHFEYLGCHAQTGMLNAANNHKRC